MRKVHSCAPRKTQLSFIYQQLVRKGEIDPDDDLERHLVAKGMRSLSGVLVITVFTAGTSWSSRAVSLEICRCRVTRCCNSNCDQWRYSRVNTCGLLVSRQSCRPSQLAMNGKTV